MPRNRTFTPREQAYILSHAGKKSWGEIARDLGRLYPQDNGGRRSRKGVQGFALQKRARVSVVRQVRVPAALVDGLDLSNQDLSKILTESLVRIRGRQSTAPPL
ncbi:hypothetical protein [Methanoculleus sp. UBA208]|uniref:hypothetical protein n=1 Tax=Methanoculleus sp. UBA208 TaxID=1915494 RepID=UPI0025DF84FD|nr:hypothetical protein [Methanoculleus sp. UBA208]